MAAHTEKIVLERAGLYPRYVPSGHLLYVRKGTLFAVPFDPVRLEVRGSPAVAVEDVSNDTNFGFARPMSSESRVTDGTAVYGRHGCVR